MSRNLPHNHRHPSQPRRPRHDVVHHLYVHPGDLLPFCGTYPGRDPETGDFHAGHDRDTLLAYMDAGMVCCAVCLSPAALGGWTPFVGDDAEMEETAAQVDWDEEADPPADADEHGWWTDEPDGIWEGRWRGGE